MCRAVELVTATPDPAEQLGEAGHVLPEAPLPPRAQSISLLRRC